MCQKGFKEYVWHIKFTKYINIKNMKWFIDTIALHVVQNWMVSQTPIRKILSLSLDDSSWSVCSNVPIANFLNLDKSLFLLLHKFQKSLHNCSKIHHMQHIIFLLLIHYYFAHGLQSQDDKSVDHIYLHPFTLTCSLITNS